MQAKIYNLTLEILQGENAFTDIIAKDTSNEYYWSKDWSEAFYIALAKKGFISTSHETKEGLILLPELQLAYGVLDFKNLHISQKVQKLLQKDDVFLHFNTRFGEVIDRFQEQHKYNWLKDDYASLMKSLHKNRDTYNDFKIISVELISKETQELIAGEVGYIIGTSYTSLSGFSSKEKKYNNYGNLQLVLLAQHLQKKGFCFWNLGHPHMEYKQKLGSITHSREAFLKRWQEAIPEETINGL